MVNVLQDPITRKWGFRVVEGKGGLEAANMGTSRTLCEDFTQNSPQEVFAQVEAIKKAFEINYVRVSHEGIVYNYSIHDATTKDIIFTEGGWMGQSEVQAHLDSIKKNIVGFPKMVVPPKPTKMSIGSAGPQNGAEVRSVYTDPVTGKVYDSGNKAVNTVDLDAVRKEAKADVEAGAGDDSWAGRL